MSDVFLSYASEDRERVLPLVRRLEERGWSVFWDHAIPAGQSWRQVIAEELRSARCVIVVWTETSVQSTWVAEEADSGRERGNLIPLLLDRVQPPLGFRAIQAHDLTEWEADRSSVKSLGACLDTIAGRLGPGDGREREVSPGLGTRDRLWGRPVAQLSALVFLLLAVGSAVFAPPFFTDTVSTSLPPGVTRLEQDLRAAEKGDPDSMALVGDRYRVGRGVKKDSVESLRWFLNAARAGSVRGMFYAGCMYSYGEGVQADPVKAAVWTRKAADAGHAPAICCLANMALRGDGVIQDEVAAARLYRDGAELGEAFGMRGLGSCFENGRGVPKDLEQALAWYRRGADAGDGYSMASLGSAYQGGWGVEEDYDEAIRWYRAAAVAGYEPSLKFLREQGEIAVKLAAEIPVESDISGRWTTPEGYVFQFRVRGDEVFGEIQEAWGRSTVISSRKFNDRVVMDGKLTRDTVTFHTVEVWYVPHYSTDAQGNQISTDVRTEKKTYYNGAVHLNEVRFLLTRSDGRRVAPVTVKRLSTRGPEKPVLGVTIDRYLPNVVLFEVLPGLPAEEAGLRAGDLITGIDDRTIRTYDDYLSAMEGKSVGDAVRIRVFRDDAAEILTIPVKLGSSNLRR